SKYLSHCSQLFRICDQRDQVDVQRGKMLVCGHPVQSLKRQPLAQQWLEGLVGARSDRQHRIAYRQRLNHLRKKRVSICPKAKHPPPRRKAKHIALPRRARKIDWTYIQRCRRGHCLCRLPSEVFAQNGNSVMSLLPPLLRCDPEMILQHTQAYG